MGSVTGFILLILIWLHTGTGSYCHADQQTPDEYPVFGTGETVAGVSDHSSFAEIARKVKPYVVNISAKRTIEHPVIDDAPFFKGPFEKYFRNPHEEKFEMEGLGSGVIVREDGYILTNNHVIENAEEIQVSMFDNQVFTAEIVGRDPTTDIAVIKIDAERLPEARLGNSDEVEVGEWVLAVGNPMRLPYTVTAGIISAKGRNIDIIPGSYSIESFIQTDAAINPGNSGGPLIDLKGEVVGINTAISTNTGYYQGYGFAIPVNLAKRVLGDLIERGRVVRAILGVSIQNVNPEIAEEMGLEETKGVRVEGFIPEDSPALLAGVREGDVIIAIDGVRVARVNELQTLVAQQNPGDEITLTVIREGKTRTFDVTLTERPEETPQLASRDAVLEAHPFGVLLIDIDEQVRAAHHLSEAIGVLVQAVDPDGPGAAAKPHPLMEGDIILEVDNGMEVASVEDMEDGLIAIEHKDELLLFVSRYQDGGASTFYTVINPQW